MSIDAFGKDVSIDAFRFACQALVSRLNLYDLSWRHHSLGMLQAEITGNLRVHLWHPSLHMLPEDSLRNVHDHRFELFSYVVHGTIIDVPYYVRHLAFAENGALPGSNVNGYPDTQLTDCYRIAHAKVQTGDGEFFSRAAYLRLGEIERREGTTYSVDRREFHTTIVRDLAITIVARVDFDDKAAMVLGDGRSGIVKDTEAYVDRLRILAAATDVLKDKDFKATV